MRKRMKISVKQQDVSNKQEDAWTTKATVLIEQHLSESDFSVENFSEEMNMSRSALYKKLMAATGKSPLEFHGEPSDSSMVCARLSAGGQPLHLLR